MTSRRLEAGSRLVIVLRISKRPDREINYGTGQRRERGVDRGRQGAARVRWFNDSYIEVPIQPVAR